MNRHEIDKLQIKQRLLQTCKDNKTDYTLRSAEPRQTHSQSKLSVSIWFDYIECGADPYIDLICTGGSYSVAVT